MLFMFPNRVQKELMKIKVEKAGLPEVKDNTAASINDPGQMGPSQQTPRVSFDGPGLNIYLYRAVTWVGAPQTRQPQEKCLRMSGINPRLIEILSHPLPPQPSFSEWRFKKQIKFDYEEKMTLHFPHIRVVDQYSCLATHRDWWCGPQVLNRKAVFPSCLPTFLIDWFIDGKTVTLESFTGYTTAKQWPRVPRIFPGTEETIMLIIRTGKKNCEWMCPLAPQRSMWVLCFTQKRMEGFREVF